MVKILKVGYCTQNLAHAIKGGKGKKVKFYALVALLHHPKHGYILFDTGYSSEFFTATKHFPYSLYAKITPVYFSSKDCIVAQLQKLSIDSDEIKTIIISHFHADHIGALKSFKNASFITQKECWQAVSGKSGLLALMQGFLPQLLPDDFNKRLKFVPPAILSHDFLPFEKIHDIFSDGTILGVDLSGHTKGQMGVLVSPKISGKQWLFFVADACWHSKSYENFTPPPLWVRLLLGQNKAYLKTLKALHDLHKNRPDIKIIPTHCAQFWSEYV